MPEIDVDARQIIRGATKLSNIGGLGKGLIKGAKAARGCILQGDTKGAVKALANSVLDVAQELNEMIASAVDPLAPVLVNAINDTAETRMNASEVQSAFADIKEGVASALTKIQEDDPSLKTAIDSVNIFLQSTEQCAKSVLGPFTEKVASELTKLGVKEGSRWVGGAIGGAVGKDAGAEVGQEIGATVGEVIGPAVAPIVSKCARVTQNTILKFEYAVADLATGYVADHADEMASNAVNKMRDTMTAFSSGDGELSQRMDTSHDTYAPSIDHDRGSPKPTISEELQDSSPKPVVPEERSDLANSSRNNQRPS